MTEFLQSVTSLPNLHPVIVHFPIALLPLAFLLDLSTLVFRRQDWLDRTTALIYLFGAIGAGGAYLAGRQAADSVQDVPAQAQFVISQHSDLALYTLILFGVIALARAAVVFPRKGTETARWQPVRILLVIAALAGQGLLMKTADLGGSLVYKYGVAVTKDGSKEITLARPDTSGTSQIRLRRSPDGALTWQPLPADTTALTGIFITVRSDSANFARALATTPAEGLAMQISGEVFLLFPDSLHSLQVEAQLRPVDFSGTMGLAYRTRDAATTGIFQINTHGAVALLDMAGGKRNILAQKSVAPPAGTLALTASVAGSHLKGFVNGKQVAHGHTGQGEAGGAGLYFNGDGIVRILSVKIIPLSEH